MAGLREPIVSVEHLRKRFGDVEIVKGVTFQIPREGLLEPLGPSRAGKTTTFGFDQSDGILELDEPGKELTTTISIIRPCSLGRG